MVCKGICPRYKASKLYNKSRYVSGQKRCQPCEIFINWNGKWCPCCGSRLRTKPRGKKYKEQFNEAVAQNKVKTFGVDMKND